MGSSARTLSTAKRGRTAGGKKLWQDEDLNETCDGCNASARMRQLLDASLTLRSRGFTKRGASFCTGNQDRRRFSDGRDASPNPSLVRSVAPAKSLALPVKIAELELALASLLLQRLQLPKDRRGVLRHRQRN